jgi:hypothetical protein
MLNERSGRSARPIGRSHKECKRDSAQPSSNELLRQGFRLTHRHIGLIFLDLLWKSIWFVLTLAGSLLVAVWFGSEFRSLELVDTGNRAINAAAAFALLRELWSANRAAIFTAVTAVLCLSSVMWFFLEAGFRSRIFSRAGQGFSTFLMSNVLKSLFIAIASLALAAICFGRYFAAPISEWAQLWTDTRGAVFIAVVTIAALGFLLTIFDTLVRSDAVALLGTDLFRVTGLIGILLLFEAMIGGSCAMMLGAGLLNVAGLRSAVAMMATTAVAVGLLNVLHSYLLLVRYSAVDIMRQNVIEV